MTGTHFVVVKDTAEQKNLLGHMNVTGEGTVTVLVMADGLKAQEYHQEQYFPGLPSENGGNPMYWQTYYGIFEAGWATGYLNLAARELGYRMRTFGSLNIVNAMTGKTDLTGGTAGHFEYIQTKNWDIEKYIQPKEGGDKFDHYCTILGRDIVADGNVTLLCGVVIGKIDESDAVSGATMSMDYKEKIRSNYDIWG